MALDRQGWTSAAACLRTTVRKEHAETVVDVMTASFCGLARYLKHARSRAGVDFWFIPCKYTVVWNRYIARGEVSLTAGFTRLKRGQVNNALAGTVPIGKRSIEVRSDV